MDLSRNRLILVEDESFAELSRLTHLNLSWNYLDSLKEKFFSGLIQLSHLDLSFNQISALENGVFTSLCALKKLDLNRNRVFFIEAHYFAGLVSLESLHLEANGVNALAEGAFVNLNYVRFLFLAANKIRQIEALKPNLKYLTRLEMLDLANNWLEFVAADDFEYSLNLKALNLNSNPIKFIQASVFARLSRLESAKLAKTQLGFFNLSILSSNHLTDLDLSFNAILCDDSFSYFKSLTRLRLEDVNFVQLNKSLDIFLNPLLVSLDLSHNEFNGNFSMLAMLERIEMLVLRHVGLQSMGQINFEAFTRLMHLDLSFNNLSGLYAASFQQLDRLEYLDLSRNRIEFVDEEMFRVTVSGSSRLVLENLKYVNLDNNCIKSMGANLLNFHDLVTVTVANNKLEIFPNFDAGDNFERVSFRELNLNNNSLTAVKYFSYLMSDLVRLNLDANRIESMAYDAFLNCRNLENLSMAQNYLTRLSENNFYYLFSLRYLNLSRNLIEDIEPNSFQNLNKLEILDLSFNQLRFIENNLFYGLNRLKDLYLLNTTEFSLYNQSFNFLKNAGNLFLSEAVVVANKCIFILSIERKVQRIVGNRFIFYKSINLITPDFSYDANTAAKCELVFNLLQFKIHLNLKSDQENEGFFQKCANFLIRPQNHFRNNLDECAGLQESIKMSDISKVTAHTRVLAIFFDAIYLATMAMLVFYLAHVFLLVFIHLFLNYDI